MINKIRSYPILNKMWFYIENTFYVSALLILISIVLLLIFIPLFGITDILGITEFGIYQRDNRTYQQKQMDVYEAFETECLSREYSKDQCLLIWGKDN